MRLSLVIVMAVAFTVSPGRAGDLETGPPRAVYFQHVGESDKPLLPFVLCGSEPETSEAAEVLGEKLRRYAEVFVLPEEDMRAVEAILKDRLDAGECTPEKPCQGYGSFEVTIVRADGRQSGVISPEGALSALTEIYEWMSPERESLRLYLKNLLHRLGSVAAG